MSLHRSARVQAVARASHASSSPPQKLSYRNALNLLAAAGPRDPAGNVGGWSRWNALLPHVDALTAQQPAALDQDRTVVRLRGILLSRTASVRVERAAESGEPAPPQRVQR